MLRRCARSVDDAADARILDVSMPMAAAASAADFDAASDTPSIIDRRCDIRQFSIAAMSL